MPFSTQIIATEPLGERGRALLPTDMCVEDVRYVLDYYRLSADGRLLFGGGTVYGGTDPADIRAKLVPNLEQVFPQLEGRAGRLRLVGQLRDLVQPGAAARAARASGPTSPTATAGTGWSAATCSAASSPRRCTATGRGSTSSRGVPWIPFPGRPAVRACPIPCSARGGMACATASAS